MWTAPLRAPCSNSSGSRTSRATVPGVFKLTAASAGSTSVMLERAVFNRSRNVGMSSETLPAWSAFHSLTRLRKLELKDVIARRRMCRSFLEGPVDPDALERALEMATHAPSAGNTQGWAFVVLEGVETALFWQHEAESSWLAHPSHPGLLNAPVIVLPLASKLSYLERYSEPDKAKVGARARGGLGGSLLVGRHLFCHDAPVARFGSGGPRHAVFRLQRPAGPLLRALGVPGGWEPLGAVAIGWPSSDDKPSTSASRPRKPLAEVVHRGRWGQH